MRYYTASDPAPAAPAPIVTTVAAMNANRFPDLTSVIYRPVNRPTMRGTR